jgi:hypothetical protein
LYSFEIENKAKSLIYYNSRKIEIQIVLQIKISTRRYTPVSCNENIYELKKPTLFRHSSYTLHFLSLSLSSLCVAGRGVPYISLKELRAELVPTTENKKDLLYLLLFHDWTAGITSSEAEFMNARFL